VPFELDLNPILKQLFNKNNSENLTKIIEMESPNIVLDQIIYSLLLVKNSIRNNRIALISGGFLGLGLGELHTAKKGFDFVKNFLDKRKEREERKNSEKNGSLAAASIAAIGGIVTNPFIALPIVIIILLKGKLPLPRTAQDYDLLPEPVKPLFKEPSNTKKFLDYYIRPIYNFKTPVPYIIIGGIIIYLNKGQILAFITNRDDYKSAFGEITSIMMNQLKNQFTEFVSFVKNTNTIFVEQLKNTQKEYTENIKETKDTLKENIIEHKAHIKERESELKFCNLNKEKLMLGYQECNLKYGYAREYFQQNLLQNNMNSNNNNVGTITAGVEENIRLQAEKFLPLLTQDVTPEKMTVTDDNGKKKK
jgi:hypothetical protein